MLRLSARKFGHIVTKIPAQPFGGSCASFSSTKDRTIQNEYNSIQNRFKIAFQLFDANERNRFHELQRQGIIPTHDSILALLVYVALCNPLLQKYRIDMGEFRKGALYAFDTAYRAISSKDLADYIAGEAPSSPSYELLQDTLNSTLFRAFTDASKELRAKRVSSVLTDLTIKKMTLCNLHTRIVPGDVPEGTEFMTDLEREVYKELLQNTSKFWGGLAKEEDAAAAAKQKQAGKEKEKEGSGKQGKSAVNASGATVRSAGASAVVAKAAAPAVPAATSTAAAPAAVATPAAAPATPAAAPSSDAALPAAAFSQVTAMQPRPATRAALKRPVGGTTNSPAPAAVPAASATPSSSSTSSGASQSTSTSTSSSTTAQSGISSASAASGSTQGSLSEPAAESAAAEADAAEEVQEEVVQDEVELSAYPPGSVVATVEMQYDVQEEYETTILSSTKPDAGAMDAAAAAADAALSSVKNARSSSVRWTFRGCISGQVPLQWTVVAFNGIGSTNSKY